MKDRRLEVFRTATQGLIESLDAVVRLARWVDADPPPEPLVSAAEKLVDRLGTADRLSSGKFNGSTGDNNKVAAMCLAMKRLDAAYVAYRRELVAQPTRTSDAVTALEVEIGATTAGLAQAR
jgi:hypothetical protein